MDLVSLLIYVLVLGLILWLVLWVLGQIPLPPPFANVARIVVVVIFVLVLIRLLMSVAGMHLPVR